MIMIDALIAKWKTEFNRAKDHETLTALAKLAKSLKDDGQLSREDYAVVIGLGKQRREELNP